MHQWVRATICILRALVTTKNKDLVVKCHCMMTWHDLSKASWKGIVALPTMWAFVNTTLHPAGGFSGDIFATSSQRCSCATQARSSNRNYDKCLHPTGNFHVKKWNTTDLFPQVSLDVQNICPAYIYIYISIYLSIYIYIYMYKCAAHPFCATSQQVCQTWVNRKHIHKQKGGLTTGKISLQNSSLP